MPLPDGVRIECSGPSPRSGLRGQWDRLVGPGAGRREQLLAMTAGLFAAVAVTGHARLETPLVDVPATGGRPGPGD